MFTEAHVNAVSGSAADFTIVTEDGAFIFAVPDSTWDKPGIISVAVLERGQYHSSYIEFPLADVPALIDFLQSVTEL